MPDWWQTGGSALVSIEGACVIASGVHIANQGDPCRIVVKAGGRLDVGADVFINWGADIYVTKGLSIGSYTMLGPRCFITDDGGHAVAPSEPIRSGEVVIGTNVWIGHSVHILPGVTIGDHTVIGAGSVVTRPIPPRVTAVGVPARPVRDIEVPDGWIRNSERTDG